ncbi:GntR family transcriptional regulator [Dactylosporangium salmoneum]|uniref:GntR family transcriptional regulator n=1 Tax=Dactylosporangium salmoneum TaxID=53361 RepID=A0ABP5TNI9_9ACTN
MPPERSQTKADQVHERLRAAILSGSLPPGARLNVDALSRDLGIGKVPLREAVQRLAAHGLVTQPGPHSGAQVATLSLTELRGLLVTHAALEALSARLAAATVADAELAALQELHEQMRAGSGPADCLPGLSDRFHAAIAAATGNAPLCELLERTRLRLRHYRVAVRRTPPWPTVIAEHASLLDALRRRDAPAAERAARDHAEWHLPADLDPALADLGR